MFCCNTQQKMRERQTGTHEVPETTEPTSSCIGDANTTRESPLSDLWRGYATCHRHTNPEFPSNFRHLGEKVYDHIMM